MLFQTNTKSTYSFLIFDMYEESYVPERLPGEGGFSIKNMSLKALIMKI